MIYIKILLRAILIQKFINYKARRRATSKKMRGLFPALEIHAISPFTVVKARPRFRMILLALLEILAKHFFIIPLGVLILRRETTTPPQQQEKVSNPNPAIK
jgi:hypothetical protein